MIMEDEERCMFESENPVVFARALADETRQRILECCCCQWLSVGEIVDQVGVGQPTVSHHLGILRSAGLVQSRQEGRRTLYTVNQGQVVACCSRLIGDFAPETEAAIELRANR